MNLIHLRFIQLPEILLLADNFFPVDGFYLSETTPLTLHSGSLGSPFFIRFRLPASAFRPWSDA